MPRSWGEVYLDSTYPSEVLSRMLRRQSAPRVLLSSLDSAFTQTAPLTPLSSAFTKTPGGMPLLLPSDFWQRSTSHVFLLPNFQTFQRSTCKRNSCFQSLPHSFFLPHPSRTHFEQLTHSLHREITPNPSAFNRFRSLCAEMGVYIPSQSAFWTLGGSRRRLPVPALHRCGTREGSHSPHFLK